MNTNERALGNAFAVVSQLMFAGLIFYWKSISSLPPFETLALRIVTSCLTAFVILLLTRKLAAAKAVFRSKKSLVLQVLCGFSIAVNWGTYIVAISHGHIIESSLAYYIVPILTSVSGILFFKEKASRFTIVSVLVAAVGVITLTVGYGRFPVYAALLSVSYTTYLCLKKGIARDALTGLFLDTASVFPFAAGLLIYLMSSGQSGLLTTVTPHVRVLTLFIGFATLIPLIFVMLSQKKMDMVAMGLVLYLSPTLSTLIGVLFYREAFTVQYAITFAFILTALSIYTAGQIKDIKQKRAA